MSPIVSGGSGAAAAAVGAASLVYRFTVSGADKVSIDTGVDAAAAGSGDFTNGDLLEVFIYARTDDAVTFSDIGVTMNNDVAAHYDRQRLRANSAAVSAATQAGGSAGVQASVAGASTGASRFSAVTMWIPNYMSTAGFKEGVMFTENADSTVANDLLDVVGFTFQSAAAITRLAVTPTTGGAKLKVGSQLLVYKRSAS